MADRDIGVPGAAGEAVRRLGDTLRPESLDTLWIFPPLARGRRESGVVVAGCLAPDRRRLLVTAAYTAEETGKGIDFRLTLQHQGAAPADRLPRVVAGVSDRTGAESGTAREIVLGGELERFEALLEELCGEGAEHERRFEGTRRS